MIGRQLVRSSVQPPKCTVTEPSSFGVAVMLFVLAERELESTGDAHQFYKAERQRWSERLRHALGQLVSDESLADQSSSMAEIMHSL